MAQPFRRVESFRVAPHLEMNGGDDRCDRRQFPVSLGVIFIDCRDPALSQPLAQIVQVAPFDEHDHIQSRQQDGASGYPYSGSSSSGNSRSHGLARPDGQE